MTANSERAPRAALPPQPTLSYEQIAERVLQCPDSAKLLAAVVSRIDAARRGAKSDAGSTFRRDKLSALKSASIRLRHHLQELRDRDFATLADAFGRANFQVLSSDELMNPDRPAVDPPSDGDLPHDGRIVLSPFAALEEMRLLAERLSRLENACDVIADRQTVRPGNPDTPYPVEAAVRLLAEVWRRSGKEPLTQNAKEFKFLVSRTLKHCAPPRIPESQISTATRRYFERQPGVVGNEP
jgi:hypothetical protein